MIDIICEQDFYSNLLTNSYLSSDISKTDLLLVYLRQSVNALEFPHRKKADTRVMVYLIIVLL